MRSWRRYEKVDKEDEAQKDTTSAALPPSTSINDEESNETSLMMVADNDHGSAAGDDVEDNILSSVTATSASIPMMISQDNKRILIEELGYRRKVVERLKFELAPVLVEKRVKCPESGVPESWCRPQAEVDQENLMVQKLEKESKFPLKVPLIGIGLILFGKGFSDALITIIKVNINFPGASLTEEFMGIPVLFIDLICTVVGAALGWWTWNNMK